MDLLTPAAQHVAMPGGRHHLGWILGEVGPELFHGLKLVVQAHRAQLSPLAPSDHRRTTAPSNAASGIGAGEEHPRWKGAWDETVLLPNAR
ncbi:MAG: hypothetical protein ACK52U_16005 [Synechococcaceae cyanobacterium]